MTAARREFTSYVADALAASIADKGLAVSEIASSAGMTTQALERRLADGASLTLNELDALAGALGMSVLDVMP